MSRRGTILIFCIVLWIIPNIKTSQGIDRCTRLTDIKGHKFETQICALVDQGYWPLFPEEPQHFKPNDLITLGEEMKVLLNLAGFGPMVSLYTDELCLENPHLGLAIQNRILKVSDTNKCPHPDTKRKLINIIFEAQYSLYKRSRADYNLWYQFSKEFYGTDPGDTVANCSLPSDYYHVAINTGVLVKCEKEPTQALATRAEAAFIIYQTFFGGRDKSNLLLDDIATPYLHYTQKYLNLRQAITLQEAITRGDFLGIATRLMKQEGCWTYPEGVTQNPFIDIDTATFPYLAELIELQKRNIIRQGEGDFSNPSAFNFNYDIAMTRRAAAIWLYRILREGKSCGLRHCYEIFLEENENIKFYPKDESANKYRLQSVCAAALGGLPFARISQIDEETQIYPNFEGVPNVGEALIMIYKMLQIDPQKIFPPEPEIKNDDEKEILDLEEAKEEDEKSDEEAKEEIVEEDTQTQKEPSEELQKYLDADPIAYQDDGKDVEEIIEEKENLLAHEEKKPVEDTENKEDEPESEQKELEDENVEQPSSAAGCSLFKK